MLNSLVYKKSFGIIAVRITNKKIQYLMLRRKNTFGYSDIIKGKCNITSDILVDNLINSITKNEKEKLMSLSFIELWYDMWGYDKYVCEDSKEKFYKNIDYIRSKLKSKMILKTEPDWEFPKGKRGFKESDIACAKREFTEETGVNISDVILIQNIIPFEEYFIGTDFNPYCYKYFVGIITNNVNLRQFQKSEVSNLKWINVDEIYKYIHTENISRIIIVNNIKKLLEERILI
jgi:ADP-ribose pyrophosphatase YjhB (NUDIX family)